MRELLSNGGWQGLVALGSALFWGLFPDVISERVTVPLFVLSLLLVGLRLVIVGRALRRQRGTAVLLITPVEGEWRPSARDRWLEPATRFASRRFVANHAIERQLPADPGQWSAGFADVRAMLDYQLQHAARQPDRESEVSLLLSTPSALAWSLGAHLGAFAPVSLYQRRTGDGEEFFRAVRLSRAQRREPAADLTLVAAERLVVTGGDPRKRAVVLDLAGNRKTAQDGLADATARGVGECLIVKGTFGRYLDEDQEHFETLVTEVWSCVHDLLDATVEVWLYQSVAVSVAFALGAHVGRGPFHCMHWTGEGYVEADLGLRPATHPTTS
ncbi:MAG: hypothetical protein ACRDZO_26545 [Egibacteraceae bacterium]